MHVHRSTQIYLLGSLNGVVHRNTPPRKIQGREPSTWKGTILRMPLFSPSTYEKVISLLPTIVSEPVNRIWAQKIYQPLLQLPCGREIFKFRLIDD